MSGPPSRRTVLASVVTTTTVTAGGLGYTSDDAIGASLGSRTVPPDRYECRAVSRPEPDPPDDDEALEPRPYPSPPSAIRADEDRESSDTSLSSSVGYDVGQFATEFERAYRQNAFLDRYGSVARTFDFRLANFRTAVIDSTAAAVLVAIRYDLSTSTRYSTADGHDEWDVRVTYYVDRKFVLRARYHGIAEKLRFTPDPRTEGALVACFE